MTLFASPIRVMVNRSWFPSSSNLYQYKLRVPNFPVQQIKCERSQTNVYRINNSDARKTLQEARGGLFSFHFDHIGFAASVF